MLFPRIDVREVLLKSTQYRGAKVVAEVDIDVVTASRSKPATNALQLGQYAERRYDVEQARKQLSDASIIARREKDGFIEAAALMRMTINADGVSNSSSQPDFLKAAQEVLEYDIFAMQEELTEKRTPRDQAVPIMKPRLDLLELIKHNRAQYELRQQSLLLCDTRNNANRLLSQASWFNAENVSRTGLTNATKLFGPGHWWNAVMLVRLTSAMLRQGKHKEAAPLVERAAMIFGEWSDDSDHFREELGLLQAAQSDIKLLTDGK
jgi:hypothetical protein